VHDASGGLVSSAEHAITLALENNPSGATLSGTTAVNASGGRATFSDIQISKAGAGYTLRATATGLTGASSAAFDLASVPGLATIVAPVDGDNQAGTVGKDVARRPVVRVTDGFGDPVANVAITFTVGSGGGTVASPDQTTDGAGLATVGGWTLGSIAGVQTLLATAPGLEGSPVTFTATAAAGPAATLAQNAGDNQEATVQTPVLQPPSVLVTDAFGNPVAGVPVTFAVTSGAGKIEGALPTSGVLGIAAVGRWTLGPTLGTNTLTAKSPGLAGSPVTFNATATAVPATAAIEVRTSYFRSVRNGSGEGNGSLFGGYAVDTVAAGGTVTWEWVGSGHNVTAAFVPANTSETHSAPFTYSLTFNRRGTFTYRCTNHSQLIGDFIVGMWGVIVIR
jgi:plastocyanin